MRNESQILLELQIVQISLEMYVYHSKDEISCPDVFENKKAEKQPLLYEKLKKDKFYLERII